jgi:formylglycine-generating enzyme required for sulfatase activity
MTELTLHKEAKQAQYFTEALNDAVGLDMIAIEAGEFLMGSPEEEADRQSAEGPQHYVQVPAFFIGRYPITQAQWQVMADPSRQINRELKSSPSRFKGDDLPVEQVSWLDAVEFCDRLSAQTKRAYRLPSEAEWEYACRAGTTTPFYYGHTITPELGNYNQKYSYNNGPTSQSSGQTTPVGQYAYPNAWGLSDIHGNVWEWCADHWYSNYDGAPTDGSAWLNENVKENKSRVLRGGSWLNNPQGCRSAYRYLFIARVSNGNIGFRVVVCAPGIL